MSTFREKVQARTDWGKPDPDDEAPVRGRKAGKKAGRSAERRRASSPITGHRQFPAFAALWFAALFGLGSLAISSEVLGQLVTAIGLPALVPAAAPPLGFTAHLLVALALTAVGAVLGLMLGLRLRPKTAVAESVAEPAPEVFESEDAGVPKVRARDAHPDAPPRRPLVLTEAFADQAEPFIDEQMVPAAPLLRSKPDLNPDEVQPVGHETWIPAYTPGGADAPEPLDLAALDLAGIDAEIAEAAEIAPFAVQEPESTQTFEAEAEAPVSDVIETDVIVADVPEPDVEAPRPTLLAATPQVPSGFTLQLPDPEKLLAGETWSPVAGAPLESLGLVQLIERLALAIAARKAAGDAGPPPSDGLMPETDKAAEPEAVIEAPVADPSAPFARPANSEPASREEPIVSARDAILRRLGAVQAQAPLAAGPGPFSRPPAVSEKPDASADAVVPLRQADPATVPASSTAMPAGGPVPIETDEALRSALATLQRMSARG